MTELEKMRAVADYLEVHSLIPSIIANRCAYLYTKEDALIVARLPGARKSYSDSTLNITVPVMDGLDLIFFVPREKVCTPTKTTKEWIEPSAGRWEQKVVEWKCEPLLAPTEDGKAIEELVNEATPSTDKDIIF